MIVCRQLFGKKGHKVLRQIVEVHQARASASSSAIEELARRRALGEALKRQAEEDAAAVKIAEAELQEAEEA